MCTDILLITDHSDEETTPKQMAAAPTRKNAHLPTRAAAPTTAATPHVFDSEEFTDGEFQF